MFDQFESTPIGLTDGSNAGPMSAEGSGFGGAVKRILDRIAHVMSGGKYGDSILLSSSPYGYTVHTPGRKWPSQGGEQL